MSTEMPIVAIQIYFQKLLQIQSQELTRHLYDVFMNSDHYSGTVKFTDTFMTVTSIYIALLMSL